MTKYWVSWWHKEEYGEFDLKWPCWLTAETYEEPARLAYCAAVKVKTGKDVLSVITKSYGIENNDLLCLEWRFVIQKPDDWTPYSDRFSRDGSEDF